MTEAQALSVDAVLSALPAAEKHGGPTLPYRVSLAVVAGLTVLLPLIYLSIVAAAAWGCWWWFQNGLELIGGMNGESGSYRRGKFFLFVTPLVCGPLMLLFLLKPLLARRGAVAEPRSLKPEDEPVLFALVHAVCDRQGAPRPCRIDLSMDVNASASFGRGLKAWLTNDLVLTLGMPLVTCLDVRQLTSVLSHEFGHFSQTLGMRAYFIIATVNQWFARVVYGRDESDERLKRWSESSLSQIMVVLMVARAGVWTSRLILKGLMQTSHLLTQSLSRQMEFDADGYSVRTVGADVFAGAMETVVIADVAHSGALHDLQETFKDRALPDNLVALVEANLDQIPQEQMDQTIEAAMTSTASMYASHPPMGVRIAHAEARGSTASMDLDVPAQALFEHWEDLSRQLTERHYETALGAAVDPEMLIPWEDVNAVGNASIERRKERLAFFGPRFCFPLVLSAESAAASDSHADSREAAAAALLEIGPLVEDLWSFEDAVARGKAVQRLIRHKHTFSLAAWGFDQVKKEDVRGAVSKAQDSVESLLDQLAPLASKIAGRAHLALLRAPEIERADVIAAVAKVRAGLTAHRQLVAVVEPVAELHRRNQVTAYLFRELEREEQSAIGSPDEVRSAIIDQASKVRTVMDTLKSMGSDAPAPAFNDSPEEVTLSEKLLPDGLPARKDVGAIAGMSDAAVGVFIEEYEVSLGLIAEGVFAIENALGLERIEAPSPEPG